MSQPPASPKVSRTAAIKLAAKADVDPRTATKFLRGEPVKGLAGERLQLGAEMLGLAVSRDDRSI